MVTGDRPSSEVHSVSGSGGGALVCLSHLRAGVDSYSVWPLVRLVLSPVLVSATVLVRADEDEATTAELTEFIEKAKMGEITNQDIPKFAKMFKVRAFVSSASVFSCQIFARCFRVVSLGRSWFRLSNLVRELLVSRNSGRNIADSERVSWHETRSVFCGYCCPSTW